MENLGQAVVSTISWADDNRLQFLMGVIVLVSVVFCAWAYKENCKYNK